VQDSGAALQRRQSANELAHPSHLKHRFPQEAVQTDTVIGRSEPLQDLRPFRANATNVPMQWTAYSAGSDPAHVGHCCSNALPLSTQNISLSRKACDYLLRSRLLLLAAQVLFGRGSYFLRCELSQLLAKPPLRNIPSHHLCLYPGSKCARGRSSTVRQDDEYHFRG
jgi:hypothetical protein